MKHFLQAISDLGRIKGRMTRNAFLQFMLFFIVFWFVALMVDQMTSAYCSFRVVLAVYNILMIPTILSAMVRRLHDTGKSGKWLLFLFGIACISPVIFFLRFVNYGITFGYSSHVIIALKVLIILTIVVLIYLLSVEGNKGINKYGPDPMEVIVDEVGGNAA